MTILHDIGEFFIVLSIYFLILAIIEYFSPIEEGEDEYE